MFSLIIVGMVLPLKCIFGGKAIYFGPYVIIPTVQLVGKQYNLLCIIPIPICAISGAITVASQRCGQDSVVNTLDHNLSHSGLYPISISALT